MSIQTVRTANLRVLVRKLESDGLTTREAQASYLDGMVTATTLQAMLNGAPITAQMAAGIERGMFKPTGWLSQIHDAAVDVLASTAVDDRQDRQREG